jgi:ferredoxin
MAHQHAADVYRQLGKKIDAMPTRAPWNDAFRDILQALYTPAEAEVLIRMPFGGSTFADVARATRQDEAQLRPTLEGMCEKGLVLDVLVGGQTRYSPSPLAIGIFEMTMMRTRGDLKSAEWARLFDAYMQGTDVFYAANCGHGEQVGLLRVVPHQEAFGDGAYVEVLDYEKASAIVQDENQFGVGLCSCRHEKQELGTKTCKTPLETCASFGLSADYMIRRGLAREVSRSEMLDTLALSKEFKLVMCADNVQHKVGFICQCCGDCCNVMLGVSKHGYPNSVVTSSYLSQIDTDKCTGCEKCAKACPIQAIQMVSIANPQTKKPRDPQVDETICLGCGVCALACNKDAVRLVKRQQRVLHPATMFERVILASLERGTLQNQLFDGPNSLTQDFLRGFVGGFLRLPPVKRALLSDQLRSRFLKAMAAGVRLQNQAWLLDM